MVLKSPWIILDLREIFFQMLGMGMFFVSSSVVPLIVAFFDHFRPAPLNSQQTWHVLTTPFAREDSAPDFVYLRCFGTRGRSIGSYSREELQDMLAVTQRSTSSVVMFGQGDAPKQALENAWDLQDLKTPGASSHVNRSDSKLAGKVCSGVVLRKGQDRTVLSVTLEDSQSRTGYLGSRHSRRRGLKLRVGEVLEHLRVEAEDASGRLLLSVCDIGSKESAEAVKDS